ncbi:MAG: GNAT family N-acetyltransferase [Candidatus Yanofskybacteria bacterium]|nr:GNAT family N-acetyltransferase [Candidatus Yanofskybacteria bacterium]
MTANLTFSSLLLEPTESQISDINTLLKQLTNKPKEVDGAALNEILSQSGVFVLLVKNSEDRVIAMATLAVRRLLLNKTAIIGDVVVDEQHRGMKLGKKMMECLINKARSEGALFISLTSHPRREAANHMYQSLGFELIGKVRESNYYRLSL